MSREPARKSDSRPPNALEKRLVERIEHSGSLSFADFMRAALYDPDHGYYVSGRQVWGRDGDYLTAPAVHPAFGASIGRLAIELDAALGRPEPFDLMEAGCGDGRLARAVTETIRTREPDLWRRLRVSLVEVGASSREAASARVHSPPTPVRAVSSFAELSEAAARSGLVYSNELLDAFPVERVRMRGGRLEQSRVEVERGRLRERFGPAVDPAVERHLRALGVELAEGQVAELCLGVAGWLDAVAEIFARGGLLTVDYGHETATLYGPERPGGTLVTMKEFRLDDDPLADPGERDITAHVDFGGLRRLGAERGFEAVELCSLRVFLIGMGAAAEPVDDEAQRVALRHLLVSEIGERHKVLLQLRDLPSDAVEFGRRRLREPDA